MDVRSRECIGFPCNQHNLLGLDGIVAHIYSLNERTIPLHNSAGVAVGIVRQFERLAGDPVDEFA